ncbi:MAG TPA: hypothetical protein VFD60_08570 [Nitrososphaeraceae archaeon]|jgi:hypothetical protein|nr:hypothetical protein [Nitrososphaeraceae archaeon]
MSSTKILAKSFASPDEVMVFGKGKVEIVNLTDSVVTVGRGILEPRWC